jgi:AcrR family transcriptional regulator
MPKQTFFNLPAAKRDAFIAIAIDEFARHPYESASVSRVVAAAGIAKGSVYQYFDDKQDLFLYLVDHAARALIAASQADAAASASAACDVFAQLRALMSASVRAAAALPQHAQMLRRAYTDALPFHGDVIEHGRALRRDTLRAMIDAAVARGELAPDIDPALASYVVEVTSGELGRFIEDTAAGDAAADVERIFDALVRLLKSGLGR